MTKDARIALGMQIARINARRYWLRMCYRARHEPAQSCTAHDGVPRRD
jgi:hypothetical protein